MWLFPTETDVSRAGNMVTVVWFGGRKDVSGFCRYVKYFGGFRLYVCSV